MTNGHIELRNLVVAAKALMEAREDQMVTKAEWDALAAAETVQTPLDNVTGAPTKYYVATLARYVLVEAEKENEARRLGADGLKALHSDVEKRLGKDVPVNILVVRPATSDEIELDRWNREMLDLETN